MATASAQLPGFAEVLRGLSDEDRLGELSREHKHYASHSTAWRILLDGFEGDGGFLDGSYLWPFPREGEVEFTDRKAMARYHNYLETLVDLYVRQLFTQGVNRTSNDEEYNEWLLDVDGAGMDMDGLMKRAAAMGLVGGHAGVLVDKTDDEPVGPRKADEQARVFLTVFPNVSIVDWRFRRNQLIAVKLLEAAPPLPLIAPGEQAPEDQWLLMDLEGWARFDRAGTFLDGDLTLALGMVPLVLLRPKPSHVSQMLGRPLVSNANILRALFNRASEKDHVLRDQAFSVLTCNVPPEGNVEEAKASLGSVIGTAKALVVKGELTYQTPSMEVPRTLQEEIGALVQEIYRLAHVRFRRDSLASETAEAIRLQHTELNEMLQGLGTALTQAERDIARAYYAWTTATEEQAQAAFEAADPQAQYPKEFFLDELVADLDAWAKAIEMDLGLTMSHHIKKKAARRVDPDLPPDVLEKVDAEIEAQTEEDINPLPTDLGLPVDVPPPAEAA